MSEFIKSIEPGMVVGLCVGIPLALGAAAAIVTYFVKLCIAIWKSDWGKY